MSTKSSSRENTDNTFVYKNISFCPSRIIYSWSFEHKFTNGGTNLPKTGCRWILFVHYGFCSLLYDLLNNSLWYAFMIWVLRSNCVWLFFSSLYNSISFFFVFFLLKRRVMIELKLILYHKTFNPPQNNSRVVGDFYFYFFGNRNLISTFKVLHLDIRPWLCSLLHIFFHHDRIWYFVLTILPPIDIKEEAGLFELFK